MGLPAARSIHSARVPRGRLGALTRLLAQYPVSKRLHARAAEFFAAQAAALQDGPDPSRWAAAICDELFHRFAGGDADAAKRWHERLREAEQRIDHRAAMALAELAVAKGIAGIDDEIRATAWRTQAIVAVGLPDGDPGMRLRRVEQAMNELDRLPPEVVDRVVPKGERFLFRAQLAFFSGDIVNALRFSDESLAMLGDEPRRVDALELASVVRAAAGRDDALPLAIQALELQRRLSPEPSPREAILARRLADAALLEGDHDTALETLRSTRGRIASGADRMLPCFLAFTEANIAVRAGRPFDAWRTIEASMSEASALAADPATGGAPPAIALEGAASLGPALLASMASTRAIQLGDAILGAIATMPEKDVPALRLLELQIRLSTGIAHRSRLDPRQATPILSGVFEGAFALRDMSTASHAIIALAEQDLTVTGNLRTMESWLATGNRLELPPRTEQLHRLAGLHVMFLGHRGAGGEIVNVVDSMRAPIVGAPPQARAAFFSAALVAEEEIDRRERAADDLLESLGRIHPAPARCTMLGKLALADALPKRPERVRRVMELLPLRSGTGDGTPLLGLSPGDATLYELAAAEAHRVMGDDFAAALVVQRCCDGFDTADASNRSDTFDMAGDDTDRPGGALMLLRLLETATRHRVRLKQPAALVERALAAGTLVPETEGLRAALRIAAAENALGSEGPAAVDLAWVAEAEPLLRSAALERSLLARRLHVLRALVHRARGDAGAAANEFGAADAIAGDSGDERERRRIATLRSAPPDDDTRTAMSPRPPPAGARLSTTMPTPRPAPRRALDRRRALWLRLTLTTSKAVERGRMHRASTGGEPPRTGVHWRCATWPAARCTPSVSSRRSRPTTGSSPSSCATSRSTAAPIASCAGCAAMPRPLCGSSSMAPSSFRFPGNSPWPRRPTRAWSDGSSRRASPRARIGPSTPAARCITAWSGCRTRSTRWAPRSRSTASSAPRRPRPSCRW
ncbi:MAG: hypothetical protein U0575_05690 [Phycisphaerales bacterium]